MLNLHNVVHLGYPQDGWSFSRWRVIDVDHDGALLACLAVGRKLEYVLINEAGIITESTCPECIGEIPQMFEYRSIAT